MNLIVVVSGPIKKIPDEQAGMTILHIVPWMTNAYSRNHSLR